MNANTEPHWYAVAVNSRQEKAAADDLVKHGIEVFLPTACERRMWSDRIKNIRRALFPGYLFVHTLLTAAQRVEILRAAHTFDLVGRRPGDDRIAHSIPEGEIDSLRTLVSSGRHVDPAVQLVRGTRVLVAAGALKGAQGIVERAADGKRRLVAQIRLLGRGVRTELDADDVIEELP